MLNRFNDATLIKLGDKQHWSVGLYTLNVVAKLCQWKVTDTCVYNYTMDVMDFVDIQHPNPRDEVYMISKITVQYGINAAW